ncbi:MAG TPA: hypothetical protein VK674_01620 [Candidatus Limnocylindria bacterium]|nr:hypothetical protein [Candidatus Limnocylindria bacterium]
MSEGYPSGDPEKRRTVENSGLLGTSGPLDPTPKDSAGCQFEVLGGEPSAETLTPLGDIQNLYGYDPAIKEDEVYEGGNMARFPRGLLGGD